MSFVPGLNPWFSMWSQPRATIRAIIHDSSSYGVYWLAAIYSLQTLFFYANWWSLGLRHTDSFLLALGVILSPLAGFIWLYFLGFVYYATGRFLKGEAPADQLRSAVAWSAIPFSISLLMWLMLIFLGSEQTFIHDSGTPSSIFVNLITLIVSVWSFVLLIQSIREIQHFSIRRSIFNVALSWILCSIFYIAFFFVFRIFYIYRS